MTTATVNPAAPVKPGFFAKLFTTVKKDEQWLVSEIAKGWAAIKAEAHKIEVDVLGVFNWIQAHHTAIIGVFQGVLHDLALVGEIIPTTAPYVVAATQAIDAATAAVDVLSKGIQQGVTPLSTVANAYHAVKDAQTAVNNVLKQGTTKPST